jgi:hypothetical protein
MKQGLMLRGDLRRRVTAAIGSTLLRSSGINSPRQ